MTCFMSALGLTATSIHSCIKRIVQTDRGNCSCGRGSLVEEAWQKVSSNARIVCFLQHYGRKSTFYAFGVAKNKEAKSIKKSKTVPIFVPGWTRSKLYPKILLGAKLGLAAARQLRNGSHPEIQQDSGKMQTLRNLASHTITPNLSPLLNMIQYQ